MEEKDLQIFEHPFHDHPLVLRKSLQGAGGRYGGGRFPVNCHGCREPISSSSSCSSSSGAEGGRGAFYACPNSNCWYLLHKHCTEFPRQIQHPADPGHTLTLRPYPFTCDACDFSSGMDRFSYRCSYCGFEVHLRCASMALHIKDRVDENKKIHQRQHPLIPIEMEAQFLCAACGREHKGKSYLCPTCGFWANQICASVPTTVDLRGHPHPLTLLRSVSNPRTCNICNKAAKRAYWVYRCSEGCLYWVHVGCWLSLVKVENSNKDIQTNFHLKSTSHEIEICTDFKEEIIINWPLSGESVEVITQLIKNFSLEERRHNESVTKVCCCREFHPLTFVNEKIDKSKNNQPCDGCGQTISSQFYHCARCNFSLHEWCAELPNKLRHILYLQPPLCLPKKFSEQKLLAVSPSCSSCNMQSNGFVFRCFTCTKFYLDLKCASLPRVIKHQGHDHSLILRLVRSIPHSCNACGVVSYRQTPFFGCETCNFDLCINCTLLPFSAMHRYDKHPFALTYFPIKGQPDYYCEICEENINPVYWFYHCIACDQSLHPKCIYPLERNWNMKFKDHIKVDFHSHLLSFVRRPTVGVRVPCNYEYCGFRANRIKHCDFKEVGYVSYECDQCDFWIHARCLVYR